ncbi:class I SAM-dependent methyltransferase [Nocardia puris]|uniref:Putative O-methyltransferase YrrM n=1 Tax=Nocardia puris TaxID=208602 RepID=A0A366D7A8_9NOCA|nr:class I SAM-dependent methyltransferase [Nocardia puris]MBF6370302.1 class I SAM-dependent methyltransferase [Nocardia puris]RBO85168.1 putative O-methyltransferase YrrM [Nocardia puris]
MPTLTAPPITVPPLVIHAQRRALSAGFQMSCTDRTGALLRTLAATKPGGRILELGTGVGVGAAWLLDGMDSTARLVTVDADPPVAEIARDVVGSDHRVTTHIGDASEFLASDHGMFDLAFVDCRPGKFHDRDQLLSRLTPGGIWVVDDLLPQHTWPADHQARVDQLMREIGDETTLLLSVLDWDSGLIVGTKRAE